MIRPLAARALAAVALVALTSACVARPVVPAVTAPRFPDYPMPEVPPSLNVTAGVRDRHFDGWQRLQGGDLRGARAEFGEVLRQVPDFYPAQAALGYVDLASGEPEQATAWFSSAVAADSAYLPGWVGQAEALLALGRDADAIAAMERILELDPAREVLRSRIELVRFRSVQSLIDAGRAAHVAGRLDEARRVLLQALQRSPSSTVILHELALVELEAGQARAAEEHVRQAMALEPGDPEWEATLGQVLDAQERYAEAADAFARAAAIDPRPEWRARSSALRTRADMAALPPEFGTIADATSVTRAQAAALVGVRLADLLRRAPVRMTDVATDVRTHWAASWILPVTRAGIMPVYPNHTFQPNVVLSRGDLAAMAVELLRLAAAGLSTEFAAWQAMRPRFEDLTPGNVRYPAAALAVAAGAMTVSSNNQFSPTSPSSGPDLEAVVRRIEAIANR
jgi:tetratricopeptide (TPR) repeat protein